MAAKDASLGLAAREDKKEVCRISGVPSAPPPPTLRRDIPLTDGKNLMKSAATLIDMEDDRVVKETALEVCKNFLLRHDATKIPEQRNISWSYHNNDVEAYLQDGPTCGLVSLKLAASVLKIPKSKSNNEIQELLKLAQESGFTYNGEMFSARDMGLLAKKYYGLKFQVVIDGLDNYVQLIEHLWKGYPVLVPYDADKNHEPCLKRGRKAHWTVITGFLIGSKDENMSLADTYTDDCSTSIIPFHLHDVQTCHSIENENLFILVRQGKSRHYAVWSWVNLNNSNKNLFEFDQGDVHNSDMSLGMSDNAKETKYVFSEGIQTGLCSKVVYLFP